MIDESKKDVNYYPIIKSEGDVIKEKMILMSVDGEEREKFLKNLKKNFAKTGKYFEDANEIKTNPISLLLTQIGSEKQLSLKKTPIFVVTTSPEKLMQLRGINYEIAMNDAEFRSQFAFWGMISVAAIGGVVGAITAFSSGPLFVPMVISQISITLFFLWRLARIEKELIRIGTEIEKLLKRINLEELRQKIEKELEKASAGKKGKLLKKLDTVESFIKSGNKPESMIKNVIPVIPPDLRPMVQLDGGRFATSDLNDLYRRVINRNNRLKRLMDLNAPEIIVKNEKRMLQESVDALMDNTKRGKPITGAGNRPLKSLSDILKGKQGRFRQNLLGKRVDYSGRSVIVVGPELKLYQCGLPREMAVELFKPFVMRELIANGIALNDKAAKRMVEQQKPEIWEYLDKVIQDHPVLLNRAPTLHRLGIQAFQPVIVEGRAIKLHPLTCAAFNADFDGDQMAVHVPLSPEAQAESRYLMLATNNLIKPTDGQPITVPSQDMILGVFYLTLEYEDAIGAGKYFKDKDEALLAYQTKDVTLQSPINVRFKDEEGSKIIKTTVGKLILNEGIPQDLGYVDRTNPENRFEPEISFVTRKKNIEDIIDRCIRIHGIDRTVELLDFMKSLGFKYSTFAGFTVSASDVSVPEEKAKIIKDADKQIDMIVENYKAGLLSDEDRYNETIKVWAKATDDVQKAMEASFDLYRNPIAMMAHSGARRKCKTLKTNCRYAWSYGRYRW